METALEDLAPGIEVINTKSGRLGVVRAAELDPRQHLLMGSKWVGIRTKTDKGKPTNTYWAMENIEIVADDA